MTLRRAVWFVFLALFAAMQAAYAVGIAVSWDRADGDTLEEAGTIFVIAGVPALVTAANVTLIHESRRGLVASGVLSIGGALAAVALAATRHDISGFIAVLVAIVLIAVAATVVAALRWDAGIAMMSAASIAIVVAAGVGALTYGAGLPISAALIVVAASTVTTARIQRLIPWWPIVLVIVVFALATSGITLIVLVPVAVVFAIVAVRRRRAASTSAQ